MPVDGAGAEEEPLRALGIGKPAGAQAQDFDLPGAESGGVGHVGGSRRRCRAIQRTLDGLLSVHRPPLRPRCLELFLAEAGTRGSYPTLVMGAVGYVGVQLDFDLL